jgi:orotate phosphoribosyltransferase
MKQELRELIKKDAFFKKRVKLASGKISDCYIDVRRVSFSSKGLYLISQILWQHIKIKGVTAIGGPTLGADPIVAGTCMMAYQDGVDLKGFIIRKTRKQYGRENLIEGKPLTNKDKIVLVDDVATSGGSLIKALDVLQGEGFKVAETCVVIDRQEGASEAFKDKICPFFPIFTKKDFQ